MILRDDPVGHTGLIDVIGRVRRRWRFKHFLRGAALVAATGLAAFVLSAWGVEKLGFSAGAVLGLRVALGALVLFMAVRYLIMPLVRRVTNEQVALYLEEHEPSLQAAVLSAIELDEDTVRSRGALSPALARRTVEQAIEKCHAVQYGKAIEAPEINRFATVFAVAAVLGLGLALFRPGFLRNGTDALLFRPAAAASPYRIDAQPGNVTIPRGADQLVGAALHGFVSDYVEIVVRTGLDSAFQRIPMVAGADSGAFELMLFAIGEDSDY
jgi:hypothetical protein